MIIIVKQGEELIETLTRTFQKYNVGDGALTLIGAVDEVELSVMQKHNAGVDLLRLYQQPMEMHGTGEINGGKVHVHATFAGEDIIAAGHVHRALVETHFVNVYVH